MYWNNNTKQGCITAKAYRIPDKIKIDSEDLSVPINVNTKLTYTKLKIHCGIICSISKLGKYLQLNPNLIFLSKSNNFTDDVYIISNVIWNIN